MDETTQMKATLRRRIMELLPNKAYKPGSEVRAIVLNAMHKFSLDELDSLHLLMR